MPEDEDVIDDPPGDDDNIDDVEVVGVVVNVGVYSNCNNTTNTCQCLDSHPIEIDGVTCVDRKCCAYTGSETTKMEYEFLSHPRW